MAFDLTIRQGDTLPVLTETILDPILGSPYNLTGCSVQFVMRQKQATAPAIETAATIVNAASGEVEYAWGATDTAVAGYYMATFRVTTGSGGTFTFPSDGYLEINIEENLTASGASGLVSLGEAKDILNIPQSDHTDDAKLVSFIDELRPVIEYYTGPIIPQQYEEWYDGGATFIELRHRPSVGYGANPLLQVQAISEYQGPIEWPLAVVASPDLGQLYSVQVDVRLGRIVRRTAGGGVQAFPNMPQSVHVVYTAGQYGIPPNVALGTKDLIRIHFQQTQMGRPRGGLAGGLEPDDEIRGETIMGFYVPGRVREMLAPLRRYPAIA